MTYIERCGKIEALHKWSQFVAEIEGSEVGEFWDQISPLFSLLNRGILDDDEQDIIINILIENMKWNIEDGWMWDQAQDIDEENNEHFNHSEHNYSNKLEKLLEKYPL